MFTISNIIEDIDRGCLANNMIEDCFSYRIIFFVNEGNKGTKHYIDAAYGSLRDTLETIIRGNLTTTNSIVIAQTTIRKGGESISLQSRSYRFSVEEYFQRLCEKEREKEYISSTYGRRQTNWCYGILQR